MDCYDPMQLVSSSPELYSLDFFAANLLLTQHLRFLVLLRLEFEVVIAISTSFAPPPENLSVPSKVHSDPKVPFEYVCFSKCWYPSKFDS